MRGFQFSNFLTVRKSIQGKIFLAFGLVTFVSIVAVTTILYFGMRDNVKQNAISSLMDSIRQADETLRIILQDIDHITMVVVTNQSNVIEPLRSEHYEVSYEWFLEQKKTDEFLSSLIAYKSYITQIALVGINGKIFNVGTPWMDKSVLDKPVFQKIMKSGGKKVYIKQDPEETGAGPTVTAGREIRYSREPIGVVMVDLNYDFIMKLYNINSSSDSRFYVMDEEGKFVYRTPWADTEKETGSPDIENLLIGLRGTNQSVEKEIDGTRYLAVSIRSEHTGWTTIGLVPVHTLLSDSIRLRDQMAEVALLVFFIVLIGSIMVSSKITKNLRRLRKSMKWVKEGNLSIPANIRSEDEVGQLYQVFVEMIEKVKQLMNGIEKREKQKREAELSVLQAQISPHFLYNTLNTIKYLARLRNADNIEEVSGSLIDLLRGVLGNTREFLTIREELEFVRSYVNIQKYKYMDPFSVHFQVDSSLLDCKILKLLLQPVVENAIIHGIGSLEQGGMIIIKILKEDDVMKIAVTDNGVGMTTEKIDLVLRHKTSGNTARFSGMGVSNVHERILLMYGEPYGVKIFSEPGMYTTVEILIPLLYDRKDALDESESKGAGDHVPGIAH
jgi:two-component system, sensor histidine kinase YesM